MTFCAQISVMTSSKIGIQSDFQFHCFVFIFWTSFQVTIFKRVEKLLWTLDTIEGAFKMHQNTKKSSKIRCSSPSVAPSTLSKDLNLCKSLENRTNCRKKQNQSFKIGYQATQRPQQWLPGADSLKISLFKVVQYQMSYLGQYLIV